MKNVSLGIKLTLLTTFVVLLTSGGLITLSYNHAYNALEESVGVRLQAIAATGALMLNGKAGDFHKALNVASGKEVKGSAAKTLQKQAEKPGFKSLQTALRKIRKLNNLKEEIYTFRFPEGTLKFAAMTQSNTYIGHSYKPKNYQAKESILRAYQDKKPSRTMIYTSPNGVWISGHAPFFTTSGKIAGVLAIDIRLETFQKKLRNKMAFLLMVSLGILVLGLLISIFFSRQIVQRLKYLRESAESISLGEMDKAIRIDAQDELGQLAQSLERMRESLKVAMDMLDDDDDDD